MPLVAKNTSHILLGPSVSAIHRDGAWDSQVGGYLFLHRKRVSPLLSSFGVAFGTATFASYDGIRISADLYVGSQWIPSLPMGLGLGAVSDVFLDHRALGGLRATLWIYTGVAPYLSLTTLRGLGAPAGTELEFGLKIPFSIIRW